MSLRGLLPAMPKKRPQKKAQAKPTPQPETEPSPQADAGQTPFVWYFVPGIY